MFTALFLVTLFLAYANGANDNFKGVATLFGSQTATYGKALGWATVTTFLGSACSVFFAEALVRTFSGKDVVPDRVIASPEFVLAVALAAAVTVFLATVKGLPISTTHSIIGALAGAGVAAAAGQVRLGAIGRSFFLPLLLSPLVATLLAAAAYVAFRALRIRLGITKEWCLCVGERRSWVPITDPQLPSASLRLPLFAADTMENCKQRYAGLILGIRCSRALDFAHYVSAGAVSFARGLNDTPKIAALMLLIPDLRLPLAMALLALAMALGGLLHTRRVALTMSRKITTLNDGQGFTANLITAVLVIFASHLGLPVSTTHVAVGSLFGISLITGVRSPRVASEIVASWLFTLPTAAILAGLTHWALT